MKESISGLLLLASMGTPLVAVPKPYPDLATRFVCDNGTTITQLPFNTYEYTSSIFTVQSKELGSRTYLGGGLWEFNKKFIHNFNFFKENSKFVLTASCESIGKNCTFKFRTGYDENPGTDLTCREEVPSVSVENLSFEMSGDVFPKSTARIITLDNKEIFDVASVQSEENSESYTVESMGSNFIERRDNTLTTELDISWNEYSSGLEKDGSSYQMSSTGGWEFPFKIEVVKDSDGSYKGTYSSSDVNGQVFMSPLK